MNQWLAEVYGTHQAPEDLEKTAQHMLLEKLAAEEGLDLSGLPPEQVDQLAAQVSQDMAAQQQGGQPQQQLAGQQGAPQQAGQEEGGIELPPEVMAEVEQLQAQGVPDEEIEQLLVQAGFLGGDEAAAAATGNEIPQEMLDQAGQLQAQQGQQLGPVAQAYQNMQLQKEAQAKFEEADFLGRAMAHAYHQELQKIAADSPLGEVIPSGGGKIGNAVETAKNKTMGVANSAGRFLSRHGRAAGGAIDRGAQRLGYRVGSALSKTHGPMTQGKMRALGYGTAALGAAATGGAAYGAKKALEKNASKQKTAGEAAVEALAEARAIEILRANGYNI